MPGSASRVVLRRATEAARMELVQHNQDSRAYHPPRAEPRYLRLGGGWRDHERWAVPADEWDDSDRKPGHRAASS